MLISRSLDIRSRLLIVFFLPFHVTAKWDKGVLWLSVIIGGRRVTQARLSRHKFSLVEGSHYSLGISTSRTPSMERDRCSDPISSDLKNSFPAKNCTSG